jgi:hypothetical protein
MLAHKNLVAALPRYVICVLKKAERLAFGNCRRFKGRDDDVPAVAVFSKCSQVQKFRVQRFWAPELVPRPFLRGGLSYLSEARVHYCNINKSVLFSYIFHHALT